MHYKMAYSLYGPRLQGIVVVEFIETNILSTMMKTATMIHCMHADRVNMCLCFDAGGNPTMD